MNLDVSKWKEFRVGDLFDIHPTKFIDGVSADDCVGIGYPLVVNSAENNGVAGLCDLEPTESGNIITFSDTTDGNTFFYQPNPFIGFAHVQGMYPKNQRINRNIMLFISAILMFDSKGRYSYGRKMRRDTISEIMLRLPADANGNPDWQFMENYIKSLHHKQLTTKNKPGQAPELNVQDWGEFDLADLFGDCERGTRITTDDRTDGNIPFCTAGEFNEGISELIGNPEAKIYKNALSIDMFGNCFYHGYDFKCDDNILVITNKYINEYTGLFLSQVISADKYRNNYGRQYRQKDYVKHKIKLPIDADGNPDWQFMEDYIKALPYGDRLEG